MLYTLFSPVPRCGSISVNRYLQLLSFSLLQVYLLESLQPTLKTLNLEATGRGTRDIEYYNLGAGVFAGIVDRKSSCCVSDRKITQSETSVTETMTEWESDFNIACFISSVSNEDTPSTYYRPCATAKISKRRCVL